MTTAEPINWVQIGQMIGGVITMIAVAYSTYKQAHLAKKLDAATEKVEEVRVQGNSNFGDMLQVGMVAAKTLAETTGKTEHQALAAVAEQKYGQHMANQAKLNTATK